MKLRGGPGSKNYSNDPAEKPPLFNGVRLFKEELPNGSKTNPFKTLPTCRRESDRPLWTYKFFDAGRGGFIVQRCYYSIYFVRFLNYCLNSNIINLCLLPISYAFYSLSIICFIRYIRSELILYSNRKIRMKYCYSISKIITSQRRNNIRKNKCSLFYCSKTY